MGVDEADRSMGNYVMCVQQLYFKVLSNWDTTVVIVVDDPRANSCDRSSIKRDNKINRMA